MVKISVRSPRLRLRQCLFTLLALIWVAWFVLSVPDGGRKQYSQPLGTDQVAAYIRAGAVSGIITQDAVPRVDVLFRDDRPAISDHLPSGSSIADVLQPYNLAPEEMNAIRFVRISKEPFPPERQLAVLRGYWLAPLMPPLLTAGLVFLAYNVIKTLLFFVVPGHRRPDSA